MPYPKRTAALASVAALAGSAVLLTAPVARADVVDVDYRCKTPIGDVRDPVFRVGTSRGVHAPQWQDLPWRGTVEPGGTARVGLPVELTAGAHGDCTVTLTYGGRILAEEPWTEPRAPPRGPGPGEPVGFPQLSLRIRRCVCSDDHEAYNVASFA
ncbi:hypothetical protein [Streptomyces sp. NPDC029526]|uniref:hypothetical protein n=1 Tax=Streptomyces sp. NPDC029526 TaxID=3155728 RepID=UPI003406CB30